VSVLATERQRPRVEARPRLLAPPGADASLDSHHARYGHLPALRGEGAALLAAIEASGLRGRGGAGFPTHVKLRSVAAGRAPIVVANGVEGEPASHKDAVLMRVNPHLVIDGAVAAAEITGARQVVIAVGRDAPAAHAAMAAAIDERDRTRDRRQIELVSPPARFVTGEESALVQWLNGGPAKPAFTPPRPFERGVRGRPTLVQNVETLANIALVARHGAGWFRELGSDEEPGSLLVTLSGDVARPGITELASGTTLRAALDARGSLPQPAQAFLIGGYFGTWVPVAAALPAPLSEAGLRPLGASLGARSIAALPASGCGLRETARIAEYLAGESAGQCGPCVFGLRAIADALGSLAACDAGAASAVKRLRRLAPQIAGRGACAHPDGATRLVESALTVFADEVAHHLAGVCSARSHEHLLPIPQAAAGWR
jgi:NADH:ubiquinone oxidoreductase subunit F (NADH-binding)